jgi:hypothetical protein
MPDKQAYNRRRKVGIREKLLGYSRIAVGLVRITAMKQGQSFRIDQLYGSSLALH